MTKENRKAANGYLREVRRRLFCRKGAKRELLSSLSLQIDELDAAYGKVTPELLCAEIGTPEEVADGMMTAEDLARLAKHERIGKLCKAVCFAALAAAAAVVTICIVKYNAALANVYIYYLSLS